MNKSFWFKKTQMGKLQKKRVNLKQQKTSRW